MKTKVYFSVPVSMDWDIVTNCTQRLVGKYDVSIWNRSGYYDNNYVKKCDVFILMLPKGRWNSEIDTLPSGVKKELKEAIRLGIPVLIAYKPSTGIWEFYDTSINTFGEGFITAVAGTSNKLYEEYPPADVYVNRTLEISCSNAIEAPPSKSIAIPTSYDRRILLSYC